MPARDRRRGRLNAASRGFIRGRATCSIPRMDMKIEHIEAIALRIPFMAGGKSDVGAWGDKDLKTVDSLVVKVTTDSGVVGWGESFGFTSIPAVRVAIEQIIAPLCIGRDAAQIGNLMLELQRKLHVFGRNGAIMFGLSAIDAARRTAGDEVEITLDVNCPWSVREALDMAEKLRPYKLRWLEEPVWPPENFDGLARLRREAGIPIAAGENVSTLMDFQHLLRAGAVDFVQPSPAKMGGITELRKVFALANAHNTSVMVHTFYDGPGLLASVHASAALGGADSLVEWRYFDLEAQLYGDVIIPKNGAIAVTQDPGLGIEPNQDVIRDYRMP